MPVDLDDPVVYEAWGHRIEKALRSFKVKTWRDLASLSRTRLLKINGMGKVRCDAIENRLREVGLSFTGTSQVERITGLPTSAFGGVYFVQCCDFVKIGYSRDIRKRVVGLSLTNPFRLELLAYVKSDDTLEARCLETELHDRFRAQRHRLEWFRYDGPLTAYIKTIRYPE